MRKYISPLILLFFVATVAQGQSLKSWLSHADSAYAKKDFYTAFKFYEVAIKYDSTRTDVLYKYAESARQFNAYTFAVNGYQLVLQRPEKQQYPESRFWLAEVQNRLGEYESARQNFELFKQEQPNASAVLLAAATKGIADCDFAIKEGAFTKKNSTIPPLNMGDKINGIYSDYAPFLWKDTLYYSSFRYIDEKDKSKPPKTFSRILSAAPDQSGVYLPDSLNTPGKNIAFSVITNDGKGIYYCECIKINEADVRCDMYYRSRQGKNVFGAAKKLKINQEGYTTTQPSIGLEPNSGKPCLYFSSDRPGGKGKMDLWFGKIQPDGDVIEAVNLSALNTASDDVTPFFHDRTRQLYFSSNGMERLGGYDIYKAGITDGYWGIPRHLPGDLNSSYDELYYVLNERGDRAIFASNRWGSTYIEQKKEACCFDLYEQKLDLSIQVKVLTFNKLDSTELKGTQVVVYELQPDGTRKEVFSKTNLNGNDFNYVGERGKKYLAVGTKTEYDKDETTLDLSNIPDEVSYVEGKLYLQPVAIDLTVLTLCAADTTIKPLPPLNNCTLHFYELVKGDTVRLDKQFNPNGNSFFYTVAKNKSYVLVASHNGFLTRTDTLGIDEDVIAALGRHLTFEMPLRTFGIPDILPLRLFFDNGIPGVSSSERSDTTSISYDQMFDTYYNKKQEFIDKFIAPLTGQAKFVTTETVNSFFERNIKQGADDLERLAGMLLERLKEGLSFELQIQGHASAKGPALFNQLLSKRRIVSVKNYFRKFDKGALKPYLANRQLKLTALALGEPQNTRNIPEAQYKDKRLSVYSPEASTERRVEIVGIIIPQNATQCQAQ
jgi:tetratricopeptide (TPR) repeat protein